MNYDVENDLDKIESSVLIISCAQDPHFPPELDGIPMNSMIKNSKIVIMDSDLGHLCFNEIEKISNETGYNILLGASNEVDKLAKIAYTNNS